MTASTLRTGGCALLPGVAATHIWKVDWSVLLSPWRSWERRLNPIDFAPTMSGSRASLLSESGRISSDVTSEDQFEVQSMDGTISTLSMDRLSLDLMGDGDLSFSLNHGDDGASSSAGSSPLGWPLARMDRQSALPSPCSSNPTSGRKNFMWEERRENKKAELSEVEMMKEKFAKLLLGEDMSGGGKGVCTALAISNAITNLSASVFGELWRLEPLPTKRQIMWRREMEWLLSVSDHIVELVPSWQRYPDGSRMEVCFGKVVKNGLLTKRRSW